MIEKGGELGLPIASDECGDNLGGECLDNVEEVRNEEVGGGSESGETAVSVSSGVGVDVDRKLKRPVQLPGGVVLTSRGEVVVSGQRLSTEERLNELMLRKLDPDDTNLGEIEKTKRVVATGVFWLMRTDSKAMEKAAKQERPAVYLLEEAGKVMEAMGNAQLAYERVRTAIAGEDLKQAELETERKALVVMQAQLAKTSVVDWALLSDEQKTVLGGFLHHLAQREMVRMAAALSPEEVAKGTKNIVTTAEAFRDAEVRIASAKALANVEGERARDIADHEKKKRELERDGMKEAARIGRTRQEAAAKTASMAEFWGKLADSAEKRTGRIVGNAVDGVVGEEGLVVKSVAVLGYIGDWLREKPVVVGLSTGALAGLSGSVTTALVLASTVEASVLPAWAAPVAGTFVVVATVAGAAGGAWLAGLFEKYWEMGRVDQMVNAKMEKLSQKVIGEKPSSRSQPRSDSYDGRQYGGFPVGNWGAGGEQTGFDGTDQAEFDDSDEDEGEENSIPPDGTRQSRAQEMIARLIGGRRG